MTENAVGIEEILVLHHSHLDVGYTHSQPVLWRLQSEYISQALDWLERTGDLPEGARPKWTCEATEPVRRWLASASGSQVVRFKDLYGRGRIGLSALRWHVSSLIDRDGRGGCWRASGSLRRWWAARSGWRVSMM